MTTPSLRRLTREQADLLKNPDPTFHAAPISPSNLYDWHFTLQGPPPPSPYSGGIYHGRIVLPPTYPLRPPSFRFLTPSGRFEVNREICLSISGHHEETWQPAWGIRTALIALRSFMDGDARGQVGGLDVGVEVRRRYALESRGWRCEGCSGGEFMGDDGEGDGGDGQGRTNREVLEAWWGYCRGRGVRVPSDDDDDDGGREGGTGDEGKEEGIEVKEEGEEAEGKDRVDAPVEERPNDSPEQHQQPQPPTIAPQSSETPPVPDIPDLQPTSQHTPVVQRDHTQSQQVLPQPQPQPQPQPRQQQQQQISPDTPWLDRAIVGVVIALAIMILRRIARDE